MNELTTYLTSRSAVETKGKEIMTSQEQLNNITATLTKLLEKIIHDATPEVMDNMVNYLAKFRKSNIILIEISGNGDGNILGIYSDLCFSHMVEGITAALTELTDNSVNHDTSEPLPN